MRPALTTLLCLLAVAAMAGTQAIDPAEYRAAVEADWLLQDQVRTGKRVTAPRKTNVTTAQDAAGGVDGRITGKWGFHTLNEKNPWWHVDLGEKTALDRVVLYNRCDNCGPRNNRILVLLSDDGKAWTKAYQHNNQPFWGHSDKKPLAVTLGGKPARFVRLALDYTMYFHLDEVQVYPAGDPKTNIALGKPADQSSVSEWSAAHGKPVVGPTPALASYPFATVLARGRELAADLLAEGAPVETLAGQLGAIAQSVEALPNAATAEKKKRLYLDLRWAVRRLALANPLIDFDTVFFAKRAPGSYSHMSDQYYGHWSRPGGGLFLLSGFRGGKPQLNDITPKLPLGSYLRPDLSHDGKRVLFAYCRFYPHMRGMANKTDKKNIPDDAKYHVYEMNADPSTGLRADGTGLRQLTRGRYDDFDARYLPDGGSPPGGGELGSLPGSGELRPPGTGGRIVFLSTRRGQAVQCVGSVAEATLKDPFLPDSYVRCGGGNSRPVAVYTLHAMDLDGTRLRPISAFENFEWTPSITADGRILYARWDYVDRHNNAYMSLWATHPDGTMPNLVYGNFTRSPHCIFEARSIPGSHRLLFTASAHHAITAGSVVRLDTAVGTEEAPPLTRLTPEVSFPEMEGWPATYYNGPYPLGDRYFLTAWSPHPIRPEGGSNDTNRMGLYLADAFGNLELLYRDAAISSMFPIPLRERPVPHRLPEAVAEKEDAEARVLVLDVYRGLDGVARGTVKRIRIIACPAKTQPQMNSPHLGVTSEDPGKLVLGTVPVEADGSACFKMPGGVNVFFQALDAQGMAVQTMRSLTYAQPGQTTACVGCHEQRSEAAPNTLAAAALREPSPITPGPEGTWPLRYDRLVQPVLDRHCIRCHNPKGEPKAIKELVLTPDKSYAALTAYGKLGDYVKGHYLRGQSVVGAGAARNSLLLAHLRKGHNNLKLAPDDLARLIVWMDTYVQTQGHFSPAQERALEQFRKQMAHLLAQR